MLETKNEAGLIVGEAVQLGAWDNGHLAFEKYGWVPKMNTPVLIAKNINKQTPPEGEIELGTIPDTNFPVLLNVQNAITHHMAILGITGCGKSVLARYIIGKFIEKDVKVIVVDFTNEWRPKLQDLNPQLLIAKKLEMELTAAIRAIFNESAKYADRQDHAAIFANDKILREGFATQIETFLQSEQSFAFFELPDIMNTYEALDYTKRFFKAVFEVARGKKNFGKTFSIVLEEAHTIIPEWNFLGVDDKKGQSIVNSIGQVALLGRKYNVGFVVIAQRTANVSKTVLTQCNTIIAFQQFDKTGNEFLSNYMGTEMADALPSLRSRHAVAVGKAFRSGVPIIFKVPEIPEPALPTQATEPNTETGSDAAPTGDGTHPQLGTKRVEIRAQKAQSAEIGNPEILPTYIVTLVM